MHLHITHPKVREVIEKCEKEVRMLTGNPTVAISFVDCMALLEFDQIANEVIKVTKASMEDVKSPSRKTDLVTSRQLISFFVRRLTKMSLAEIGEKLGDRDHTTILSNVKRINALLDSGDRKMSDLVKKINRRLKEVMDEQY